MLDRPGALCVLIAFVYLAGGFVTGAWAFFAVSVVFAFLGVLLTIREKDES
jgi:hypothetical protein